MTADDLPRVLELERQASSAAHWTENDYRAALSHTDPVRLAEVMELDETDSLLVQFAEESRPAPEPGIQGFIVARLLADEMEIENIVVASGLRRFGLGALVLEHLVQTAKNQGIRRVFLEVRESNTAARKLYEKAGFSVSGQRRSYYRDPDEDALLLQIIFP
jgi:ribosomal-protein-alanine N-acetyltransferase